MKLFGFGKKEQIKAPKWSDLTAKQRAVITKKILNMAGPQYTVVSGGFDETQRRRAMIERQDETDILDGYKRGRLLDLVRNACRSSASWQTILKQYDFNAVGTSGGKVILNFPDVDFAKELRDRFADWTRQADFFDGLSFNYLLKLILKTVLVGGDTVIQFDDDVTDSGKLLVYESDELGCIAENDLYAAYGENAHQSQGKVYDAWGRWIGAIVSRNQRGEQVFDAAKSFLLKRDPNASLFDCNWIMPQNYWRIRQGRGVSQAASSIATILDMEDLCQFELQAAKSNARTFAQIYHTGTKEEQVEVPSAFDESTDFEGMTDAEIEAAAKAEAQDEKIIRFNKAESCGIVFEQLPEDWKMEMLSTPHPNEKIVDYVKWLAGRSSAAFGLSEAYATMTPTGESFRAQQLLTQPAWIEAQKFLESNICDWVFCRFVKRLVRLGEINPSKLPERYMDYVSWQWPGMDELDPVAHQNAVEMKLKNLTGSLRDELGPDWKDKLLQIKEEIDFCKENGLPLPQMQMVSGGMREEYYSDTAKTE